MLLANHRESLSELSQLLTNEVSGSRGKMKPLVLINKND